MFCKQKKEGATLQKLTQYDPHQKTVSLPLDFEYLAVDILSKEFTKLNNHHVYRIHYLGPRPHNTITLHKKYAYCEKNPLQYGAEAQNAQIEKYNIDSRKLVQSHLIQEKLRGNSYYRSGLFYRAFEGMNPYLGQGQWIFNSLFQSGNLDCVIKIEENEFDLFLRVDSNTKGHVQWFYFSVKNGKRRSKLKMNLCNLSKGRTLYDLGLQPYVFSKRKNALNGTTWTQSGVNLGISKKELRYEYLNDKLPGHMLSSYCLELLYNFEVEDDQVFFAYCIPFTFSQMLKQISLLPSQWVKATTLGKSLSGIDIPLLHISNHQVEKEKKNILITGRWHPGESNSSHMLFGFINFLAGTSREAADLRNKINFFIVPMANPDGVICGNSRTSMAGKDLNRQFTYASKQLYPQVFLVKELAKKIQTNYGLFMYLDFHGHSRKKNTFFYGPSFPIHEPNYYKCRIFPKLIEKVDSNFRFYSCTFTVEDDKKHTARAIIFEHLKVALSFTIETSIGYFYDCEKMKTQQFNEHEWKTIGTSISQGLSKFVVGFEEYEQLMMQRKLNRQRKRPPTPGKHAFTQQNNQQQEMSSYFKPGPPLKISYQDKSLFVSMIEEIKSTKSNNFIKEIDQEYDSDSHDDAEEYEESKMKEFNNLLRDAAKKDPLKEKAVELTNKKKSIKSHRLSEEIPNNQLEDDQELRFLEELEGIRKTVPAQPPKQISKKVSLPPPKTASQNKRKYQNPRMTILSQIPSRVSQQEKQKFQGRKQIEKKISSQSELNEKMSYFGEFRIFVDKEKVEDKIKSFHRNSVFNRQKSRNSKRSVQDETRFMSETFFQKPNHTSYLDRSHNINPPKSINFEFKFDEIDTADVAKQKLKEYLRSKVQKNARGSTIGPASFYGMRQNINQKKSNHKQRFLPRGDSSNKKDSIKIIKFT